MAGQRGGRMEPRLSSRQTRATLPAACCLRLLAACLAPALLPARRVLRPLCPPAPLAPRASTCSGRFSHAPAMRPRCLDASQAQRQRKASKVPHPRAAARMTRRWRLLSRRELARWLARAARRTAQSLRSTFPEPALRLPLRRGAQSTPSANSLRLAAGLSGVRCGNAAWHRAAPEVRERRGCAVTVPWPACALLRRRQWGRHSSNPLARDVLLRGCRSRLPATAATAAAGSERRGQQGGLPLGRQRGAQATPTAAKERTEVGRPSVALSAVSQPQVPPQQRQARCPLRATYSGSDALQLPHGTEGGQRGGINASSCSTALREQEQGQRSPSASSTSSSTACSLQPARHGAVDEPGAAMAATSLPSLTPRTGTGTARAPPPPIFAAKRPVLFPGVGAVLFWRCVAPVPLI